MKITFLQCCTTFKNPVLIPFYYQLSSIYDIVGSNALGSIKKAKRISKAGSRGRGRGSKAYCDKNAKRIAATKGIHLAAIKTNNMKDKNRELDLLHQPELPVRTYSLKITKECGIEV